LAKIRRIVDVMGVREMLWYIRVELIVMCGRVEVIV